MLSPAVQHIGRTRGLLVYAPGACLAFSIRSPIFVFRHVTAIVYRPRVLLSTIYLVNSGVLITGASTANRYTSGIDRSIRTTTYKFSLFSFASCRPYFLGSFSVSGGRRVARSCGLSVVSWTERTKGNGRARENREA